MRISKKVLLAAALIGASSTVLSAASADNKGVFRVCADGHYLPMSNREEQGFENEIAALLAKAMDKEVEYFWFPQRMGFIRNTLRKQNQNGDYLCDVVMGVPYRYELTITTQPLYTSTYAMVFFPENGLDDVHSVDDVSRLDPDVLANLRVGVHERNPGARWLADQGMFANLSPYVAQVGDPNVGPNELEERDLFDGKIQMAVVWGPVAGRMARHAEEQGRELRVLPFDSTKQRRMAFSIALGVRHPDKELRNQLDVLLEQNRAEIDAILTRYKVPLLANG